MGNTGIGQSVRRVEDFRFLTGNGQYVAETTQVRFDIRQQ